MTKQEVNRRYLQCSEKIGIHDLKRLAEGDDIFTDLDPKRQLATVAICLANGFNTREWENVFVSHHRLGQISFQERLPQNYLEAVRLLGERIHDTLLVEDWSQIYQLCVGVQKITKAVPA